MDPDDGIFMLDAICDHAQKALKTLLGLGLCPIFSYTNNDDAILQGSPGVRLEASQNVRSKLQLHISYP